jgi:eukaryotic-like serine/threonine-protein kinase
MSSIAAARFCETCGSRLDTDAPSDFCTACLLDTVMRNDGDASCSGAHIGDFELLEEVGHGGMGIVYRARQRVPPRTVALKMILPGLVSSAQAVARFRAEAEAAASLDDPGILPIYSVGNKDGAPFYTMKFAEGGSLSARLNEFRGKPREAAILIAALARAVQRAHEHGILHRDLKPGNVLFDAAGQAYVSDFGLAKWLDQGCDLTHTLAILGTPYYMAPEQASNSHAVTAAADVYSLGAILYHVLTGNPPVTGETPMEVLHHAAKDKPRSPRLTNRHLPRDLETICMKCLEKEPPARYRSAANLAHDLERFCAGRTILGQRAGVTKRAWRWARRNPSTTLVAACLVALAAATSWIAWQTERVILSNKSAKLISTVPEKSIAVLPFENLSGNVENAYFTEGIQEEILTRLAKIADLKVISRSSTQHFKSSPDNLTQVSQQLGVENILEGSVQRAADQVHVNVRLIKAATNAHLWAEVYDRNLTDIFAAEAEIAKTIADTLHAKLTRSEETAIAKGATANPEAHEFYLKGRFFWNKRTSVDLRTAIDYFNQALDKDPNYALAYAGLADSYNLLPAYGAAFPMDAFPQGKAAAKKALDLDDMLAEAHASLANVLGVYDLDFEQSIKEFERAIHLNPNYATAHHGYSSLLVPLGQLDRAISEGKRAVELDPFSLVINTDLGFAYFFARRYDEAIAQLHKTIEMNSYFYYAHWSLATAWQGKGDLQEAIAEYRKGVELNDDPTILALLGQAYARVGQRKEAQRILERLTEEARSRYVHPYSFALMYLGLSDKERAIDELERAYRERGDEDILLIKVDPLLDELRGSKRFEALVQKIFAGLRGNAAESRARRRAIALARE